MDTTQGLRPRFAKPARAAHDAHRPLHPTEDLAQIFYTSTPSEAFVKRMAASGAFLVTTFAIMGAELTRFHPERLDDPLVRLVVPAIERDTARDPAAARFFVRTEIGFALPWALLWLRDVIARVTLREASSVDGLRSAQRVVAGTPREWMAAP